MQVTVMLPFLTKEGLTQEGQVIDVDETHASELKSNGLIVSAGNKPASFKGVSERPTETRPTGGQTGAVTSASSLLQDLPLAKRTYTQRKAVPDVLS